MINYRPRGDLESMETMGTILIAYLLFWGTALWIISGLKGLVRD
jgi:hypothetical protein